ncbi:hypothetical protein DFH09DRAFT_1353740 [Mycena vulgaris]|nr:hypothetical protein DFH09DRAFT_1353740 [Mycena vulgaris]
MPPPVPFPNLGCTLAPLRSAAIHRFPSEILVEIFALCWSTFTPAFDEGDSASSSLEVEMSRLAHAPLLTLSQVCSRWHTIVVGTPALWTTIELDNVLWSTPTSTVTAMALLTTALERSGKCLLNLEIDMEIGVGEGPALQLLAEHAARWKTLALLAAPEPYDLHILSSAKGKLHYLEKLALCGSFLFLDIFADAPRLKTLECDVPPDTVVELAKFPLKRLRNFQCAEALGLEEFTEVGDYSAISLMPRLSKTAKFTLLLSAFGDLSTATHLPAMTSNIPSFRIEVRDGFSANDIGTTMAKILDSLTLPGLQELKINSEEYPSLSLPWAHTSFLALSSRSSFHAHLLSLQLYHSVITEPELLECLSDLPCLKYLAVSDHQLVATGGVEQLLITDALFKKLTATPDAPSLVPRLQFFDFQSTLQFDDHVYLNFLLSRLHDGCTFTSDIFSLSGRYRDLDADVLARIEELDTQGKLSFSFSAMEFEDET